MGGKYGHHLANIIERENRGANISQGFPRLRCSRLQTWSTTKTEVSQLDIKVGCSCRWRPFED